jgi:hypothetical protein
MNEENRQKIRDRLATLGFVKDEHGIWKLPDKNKSAEKADADFDLLHRYEEITEEE